MLIYLSSVVLCMLSIKKSPLLTYYPEQSVVGEVPVLYRTYSVPEQLPTLPTLSLLSGLPVITLIIPVTDCVQVYVLGVKGVNDWQVDTQLTD